MEDGLEHSGFLIYHLVALAAILFSGTGLWFENVYLLQS